MKKSNTRFIFFMIWIILITGCTKQGESGSVSDIDDNSVEQGDVATADRTVTEDTDYSDTTQSMNLKVSIISEKEAEFIIEADDLQDTYTAQDDFLVQLWSVQFDSFMISAQIFYNDQENKTTYTNEDIMCSLDYYQAYEDGSSSTEQIEILDYEVDGTELKLHVQIPEQALIEQVITDASDTSDFSFYDIEQYCLSEYGNANYELYIAAADALSVSDIVSSGLSGIVACDNDSLFFKGKETNYLLYNMDVYYDGDLNMGQDMQLVFDDNGNLTDIIIRFRYFSGYGYNDAGVFEAIPSSEEELNDWIPDRLRNFGYTRDYDENLIKAEFIISDNVVYLNVISKWVDYSNDAYGTQTAYQDFYDWIMAGNEQEFIAFLSPFVGLSESTAITLVDSNEINMNDNRSVVENYCTLDQLEYSEYIREWASDDYYATSGGGLSIIYFDENGDEIETEYISLKNDNNGQNLEFVEGTTDIGFIITYGNAKKEDYLLNFQSELDGNLEMLIDALDSGRGSYFSKPYLN